jgi:hypothetical protein
MAVLEETQLFKGLPLTNLLILLLDAEVEDVMPEHCQAMLNLAVLAVVLEVWQAAAHYMEAAEVAVAPIAETLQSVAHGVNIPAQAVVRLELMVLLEGLEPLVRQESLVQVTAEVVEAIPQEVTLAE